MSLDERHHAATLAAAITAQLGPWAVYEYGEVPGLDGNGGDVPAIYVLMQVERRGGVVPLRGTAQAGRSAWRASIRAVGRTVDECRWALLRITTALNEQTLAVDGEPTSPIQLESTDSPAPDDGVTSALSRWTYTV